MAERLTHGGCEFTDLQPSFYVRDRRPDVAEHLSRTLKWVYEKDSYDYEGDDCGWVDGLYVGPSSGRYPGTVYLHIRGQFIYDYLDTMPCCVLSINSGWRPPTTPTSATLSCSTGRYRPNRATI